MAANNLRIIYDNQVDYTNSAITASSTATTSTVAANLKSDTRSLVWRSTPTINSGIAVITKSALSTAATGVHSNITLSTSGTGTPPTLYYTLTPIGGTELGTATTGATTTVIADTAAITGLVLRTYTTQATSGASLVDAETIPVLLSSAGTITSLLTNDYHRVPSDATGTTMTYTGSGTNIYVFDGLTPLRYSTAAVTTPGVFTVASSGTSISAGSLSAGTNNAFAICGQHLNMSANSASVGFTITGRSLGNTVFTSTATQSLVKTLGNTADPIYSSVTTSTLARALVQLTIPANTNPIDAAVLTYTNLSRGSTIRILGYNTGTVTLSGVTIAPNIISASAPVINTNHQLCCPFTSTSLASWTNLSYGTVTWGLDRQLARAYVPLANQTPCTTVVLDIVDPNSTDRYIEASKFICGEYWSPVHNTEYGLSVGLKDDSEVSRSENGNLITSNGVVYKTMSFDLNHLTSGDRTEMVKLLRNSGRRRGIFISLFPENTDDLEKEGLYQLYGKLSEGFDISHPYYEYFSTSVQLEEI